MCNRVIREPTKEGAPCDGLVCANRAPVYTCRYSGKWQVAGRGKRAEGRGQRAEGRGRAVLRLREELLDLLKEIRFLPLACHPLGNEKRLEVRNFQFFQGAGFVPEQQNHPNGVEG